MQLNDLRPAEGAKKARKRVGRGNSSGYGTYSGRGVNGQLSRSGGGKGPNFEGGQMKLSMRLPKLPGFRNVNTVRFAPVNVERLDAVFSDGDVVDGASLVAKGVIKDEAVPVKVLGQGNLTKKLIVRVDAVSASATSKIEAAGGKVEPQC